MIDAQCCMQWSDSKQIPKGRIKEVLLLLLLLLLLHHFKVPGMTHLVHRTPCHSCFNNAFMF